MHCGSIRPIAPTSPPMLVPTMTSYSIPSRSIAFRTPTCAIPRIPPPPRTSTVRGRAPLPEKPSAAPPEPPFEAPGLVDAGAHKAGLVAGAQSPQAAEF